MTQRCQGAQSKQAYEENCRLRKAGAFEEPHSAVAILGVDRTEQPVVAVGEAGVQQRAAGHDATSSGSTVKAGV